MLCSGPATKEKVLEPRNSAITPDRYEKVKSIWYVIRQAPFSRRIGEKKYIAFKNYLWNMWEISTYYDTTRSDESRV